MYSVQKEKKKGVKNIRSIQNRQGKSTGESFRERDKGDKEVRQLSCVKEHLEEKKKWLLEFHKPKYQTGGLVSRK